MTDATGHLPYWTLEQLADDGLSHRERSLAEAHLRQCGACQAELDSARALVAALERLPALSPSAGFADAVMARVQVAPAAAVAAAPARSRVRRWLPATQKGWMMLAAFLLLPLVPLGMLGSWLQANPMVSVGALWTVVRGWMRDVAWSGVVETAGALGRSGVLAAVGDGLAAVPGPAAGGVPVLLMVLLAAVPLSAWMMVRLLRTPVGGMTHAY